MATYFFYPFGTDGDLTAIPITTQVSGSISYQQGYGPDYELNLLTNPAAIPIGRQTMNQLFFDITTLLQQYSQYGTPPFITTPQNQGTPFPYPIFARTYYSGQVYENQVAGNVTTPGADSSWVVISNPTSSLTNYFSGFLTSDDGTFMMFGPGSCADSTNASTIVNPSTFTKNMTTAWAAGSGNGGVPSGVTLTVNTSYYDFVIAKPDGTVDFGLDTDINATNLLADATGFTLFKRIRAHFTQAASTNIETMYQSGREFYYVTYRIDYNDTSVASGDFDLNLPLSLPLISCTSIVTLEYHSVSTSTPAVDIYPTATPAKCQNIAVTFTGVNASLVQTWAGISTFRVFSDDQTVNVSLRQGTVSNTDLTLTTLGWVDTLDG